MSAITTVVAVADLHGNLPDDLPAGELLLIAGDVCPVSDHEVAFQARWLEREFYPWLERLPHPEIAWIAGNHDFVCQTDGWRPGGRGRYLLDERVQLAGLTIYGTPWIPTLQRWAFYADEQELARRMGAIPEVDVLLSHGPPRGWGDRTVWGSEAGSPALRDRLLEIRPQLCVFGHIHEAYGRWQQDKTTLANVSYVDQSYTVRSDAAMSFELAARSTGGD